MVASSKDRQSLLEDADFDSFVACGRMDACSQRETEDISAYSKDAAWIVAMHLSIPLVWPSVARWTNPRVSRDELVTVTVNDPPPVPLTLLALASSTASGGHTTARVCKSRIPRRKY